MKKSLFVMTVTVVMMVFVPALQADVVRLKNGKVVEGAILEKSAESVKVDIGGVTLTYYADEIASVEGDPRSSPLSEAAASKPDKGVTVVEPVMPQAAVAPVEPVVVPSTEAAPAVKPEVAAPKDDLESMDKDALIRKFVQVYGVKENMQENFKNMMQNMKPEQAETFRKSIKPDEIIEELYPIYNKYFTPEELRTYIRFYASVEGKKLSRTLPLLMKDSVGISIKYLETHLPESLR